MKKNTIAAIATAMSSSGIGIIRISGEQTFAIIKEIFRKKNGDRIDVSKSHRIHYGYILDGEEVLDEVLVLVMRGPHSYTAEDTVEIDCHGGILVMRRILETVIKCGARPAEPGEFTKRAFLNGRMDLSQAEAVIDVINSKTDKEAKVSMQQLQGNLSEKIFEIRKEIISIMADIEASIDYPEYDLQEVTNENILNILNKVDKILLSLENSFYNGKILKEGISTAIIGRPNAGKSSLLNVILNEERAIVTDIEGTTRDIIQEYISVEGVPLKIIDTAGIRNSNDEVEKIGIKKAIDIARSSDIVIAIFDINRELNDEDKQILSLLENKNAIIILNKVDLERKIDINDIAYLKKPIVEMSTKNREGIDELYKEISQVFKLKEIVTDGETIISNVRHKNIIINSRKNLDRARETINNNMPIDIISTYLKEILEELGKITGETVTDDVIAEIFSKFCLGK